MSIIPETQTLKAFLSYNREDYAFARQVRDGLRQLDVWVWFDEDHRDPRSNPREEQYAAIESTRCFLILLGPHGLGKEQARELNYAISLRDDGEAIGLIPILIPGYPGARTTAYQKSIPANYLSLDFKAGINDSLMYALASVITQTIKTPPPTHIVGREDGKRRVLTITGGSGAGTFGFCQVLAERLQRSLGKECCRILSMDRYYTGDAETRAQVLTNVYGDAANYDDPAIIDFAKIASDIALLKNGSAIKVPKYDKQRHAPVGLEMVTPPSHLVLVEGTYLLQNSDIRDMSDATVYVAVHDELRFLRRIWKDVQLYGMGLSEALSYYFRAVKPAFEQWVHSFRNQATFSLSLDADYSEVNLDARRCNIDYVTGAEQLVDILWRENVVGE